MKGMDIPALEAFVAAVEEKSLSRAAERTNLVTSAASKRVAELERHLQRTLLQRHGRGVAPTPAGTLLYERAKAILRAVHLAESAVKIYTPEGQAKIRLAANPSTILQFLPDRMGRFLSHRDDVSVDLLEAHSYDIPRLLIEGTADIGIYHADHPAAGVASLPFATDRVGLVVPLGHALAGRGELFLEEALDYDLLGYFPRHSLEQFLAYIGKTLTRPPTVKLQVSNFETRCRMIREGLGIGMVPERIAANYLAGMGLVLLRLKDDWAARRFFLAVHDTDSIGPAVADLMQFLADSEAHGAD